MKYPNKKTLFAVKKEEKHICKNTGLLCARIVLLFFLFLLFFFLRPTSIYLFTAFAFFPSIIDWLFSRNRSSEQRIVLESCAKKYHFTYHHYIGEKYTGILIILALIFWQFMLLGQEWNYAIIQKAPAICMFFYLITRLTVAKIVKTQINTYYKELECLEIK